jgi:hypothetical protein
MVACGETTVPSAAVPVGVVTLFARSGDNGYVARPEGLFALASGPPTANSRSTVDTCQVGDYVPQSTSISIVQVDAGDSLVFAVGAATTLLRPIKRFGITVYAAQPAEIGFVPGSEVTFTVPGAPGGFPATTISSLTPAALTSLTPISSRPPLDQPLDVAWSPVGDDSSRVEVLLIFARQGTTEFNEQVVCDWRDDGTGVIRAQLLGGWSLSEVQRIEVSRYRTQRQEMGDTVMVLLATFDTVPAVAPPPAP